MLGFHSRKILSYSIYFPLKALFSQRPRSPMIDLKSAKASLRAPERVKGGDLDAVAEKKPSNETKAVIEKQSPPNPKEPSKREKPNLETYFLHKEKELSSRILKAESEKEIARIYKKEKHKKPIHYVLMLYKIIAIQRSFRRLRGMQQAQLKTAVETPKPQNLWENPHFLRLCEEIKSRLDSLNPDTINKLVQSLSMIRTHKQPTKELFQGLINYLLQEKNVLLFDGLQCAKLLVYLNRALKRLKNVAPNHPKLIKLIAKKVRTEIPSLPLTLNRKLYACLRLISSPSETLQVLENLNKSFYKALPRLKPADSITILYSNFTAKANLSKPSESPPKANKPKSKFLENLIAGLATNYLSVELKLRELNRFMEVLAYSDFEIKNRDLFIETTIQRIVSSHTRILGFLLAGNKRKDSKIRLPFLTGFLASLQKLAIYPDSLLPVLTTIREKNLDLPSDHYAALLIYLSQAGLKGKTLDLYDYFCQVLSQSGVHSLKHEDLPNLLGTLNYCQTPKITIAILKRVLGFLCNNLYKFSDLNLCRFLASFRGFGQKNPSIPALEILVKSMNRNVLKTEYYSLEETEEIKALREMTSEERTSLERVSSFLFMSETYNENYKLLVRRQTQIVNGFWLLSSLLMGENGELSPSIVWKEFSFCLKNIVVPEILTIDNIQKLYDLSQLFGINNLPERAIFFQSPLFEGPASQQTSYILNNFAERNKKFRTAVLAGIESELARKHEDWKAFLDIEIAKITKDNNIPIDILISRKSDGTAILAVLLAHIYEEMNQELNTESSSFTEYFRIKSAILKSRLKPTEIMIFSDESQVNSAKMLKILEILEKDAKI